MGIAISPVDYYNLSRIVVKLSKSFRRIGKLGMAREVVTINGDLSIPINPDLVWDYDIPPEAEQSEAFRRWYIARVLTRGRAEDLKAIGLRTIYRYFPNLNLPGEIHYFWEWYFSLPEIREIYGDTNPTSAPDVKSDRSEFSDQ